MSGIFTETTIKAMTIANRFVRSATWEGMANKDGTCTEQLIHCMVELANGGVGLIITGHAFVSTDGQAAPRQTGIYSDDMVTGLAEMTSRVHEAGGKIVLQLAHAGCVAPQKLTGRQPIGPSVLHTEKGPIGQSMTRKDIDRVVEAFGQSAGRAEKAGFDGVQIHAAHGYLLSQFLSPFFNTRTDEYSGTLENRLKMVLEVFQSIKSNVAVDYPVMIKLNSQDFLEGGLNADEALHAAAILSDSGMDAIELSGGTLLSDKLTPVRVGDFDRQEDEVFYKQEATRYKKTITTPLMLVGGIRSFAVAERLVNDGMTDYVSMSRPLIREPNLINRWKSGDLRKATCISDNGCFKPGLAGKGIYCVVEKRKKQEYKPRI